MVIEQEKAFQLVQAVRKAALPCGPFDAEDPVVPQVSVADRDALCSLWQATVNESLSRFLGFGRKSLSSPVDNYSVFETAFDLLLGLYRDGMLGHGPPTDQATLVGHHE